MGSGAKLNKAALLISVDVCKDLGFRTSGQVMTGGGSL